MGLVELVSGDLCDGSHWLCDVCCMGSGVRCKGFLDDSFAASYVLWRP